MIRVDGTNWLGVRALLLAVFVAQTACPPTNQSSGDGKTMPPLRRECKTATTCADCIQTDAELCIWCAGSASCEEYPTSCGSHAGNHGYFDSGAPLYSGGPRALAEAACNLPCATLGEVIRSPSGVTFNPEPCCSTAPFVSSVNGLSCPAPQAGENCIGDDCKDDGTCQSAICVAAPPKEVVCEIFDNSCSCSLERPPFEQGWSTGNGCRAGQFKGGLCCAPDGWPNSDLTGNCNCFPFVCVGPNGQPGSTTTCDCSPDNVDEQPTMFTAITTACSGGLCCAHPDQGQCYCTVDSLGSCSSALGGFRVNSCSAQTMGCPEGSHLVSSCH